MPYSTLNFFDEIGSRPSSYYCLVMKMIIFVIVINQFFLKLYLIQAENDGFFVKDDFANFNVSEEKQAMYKDRFAVNYLFKSSNKRRPIALGLNPKYTIFLSLIDVKHRTVKIPNIEHKRKRGRGWPKSCKLGGELIYTILKIFLIISFTKNCQSGLKKYYLHKTSVCNVILQKYISKCSL